ncbi:hypothetical protein [Methanolobus sp.]|uniref:hypothetical protein n=1 Tax=Methanolobus sp. TaxID=1874737 RepID=UPI00258DE599|nr:hypothetical protein [Methanolobus sp.]
MPEKLNKQTKEGQNKAYEVLKFLKENMPRADKAENGRKTIKNKQGLSKAKKKEITT